MALHINILRQLLPGLLVLVFPLITHAQEKGRHIRLTDQILNFRHEALSKNQLDWCRLNVNSGRVASSGQACDENTCTVSKKHLAGHCGCPTTGTRMVDGKYYTLLNPCEEILLYKRIVNLTKWTSVEYYFGKGPDAPLFALTKENLKKAFPDNRHFHTTLDALFRTNSQLSRFDRLNNMYLVNWLYNYIQKDARIMNPALH